MKHRERKKIYIYKKSQIKKYINLKIAKSVNVIANIVSINCIHYKIEIINNLFSINNSYFLVKWLNIRLLY